jgi:hypothetical protein
MPAAVLIREATERPTGSGKEAAMSTRALVIGLVSAIALFALRPELALPGTPAESPNLAHARGEVTGTAYRSDPPTYAVPLVDGRTAIVWLDARTDAAQPRWVCEVSAKRDGSDGRREVLAAAATNWRAALSEAVSLLGEFVADGE